MTIHITEAEKRGLRVLLREQARTAGRKAAWRRRTLDEKHWCGGALERVGRREVRCLRCDRIRFDPTA
jgi:hypothetical protein